MKITGLTNYVLEGLLQDNAFGWSQQDDEYVCNEILKNASRRVF